MAGSSSRAQRLFPVLLVMVLAVVEATPPGIANNPSHATCNIRKYKLCYNLVQVCPKFCPDSCSVECASCKPICGASAPESPSPPQSESPPPPVSESPPPVTFSSPPPPVTFSSPPPTPTASPPPPSPTVSPPPTPSSPPPETPTVTLSPPPPTPSPPPPTTDSPPPVTPAPETPPSSPTKDSSTPTTPAPETPPSPPTTDSPPPTTPAPETSPSPPTTESPPPTTPATQTPPSPPTTESPPPATPAPETPPSPPTTDSPPPTTPTPETPPPPTTSPPPSAKIASCKNKTYAHCYNVKHACPADCPGTCEVDCVSCKPVCSCDQPGSVCQDPRFIGGDGLTFYFHGKKNNDFCIVSDSNLHINAHFIGKRNQDMKRDFTWVQSIGILFNSHRLYIGAIKTATWDNSVERLAIVYNGQPIYLPESRTATWQSNTTPSLRITRTLDTNNVQIEVEGNFKISAKVVPISEEESRVHNYNITKDDCFAHLDLGFKFLSLTGEVNGVLGQTYREDYVSQMKMGIAMPVMGGERKFASSSIFATDCAVARFTGDAYNNGSEEMELPGINCASGMDRRGVVCKR